MSEKRNFDYPEVTPGSKLAREIRAEANKLTPQERAKYLRMGMAIINKRKKKKGPNK